MSLIRGERKLETGCFTVLMVVHHILQSPILWFSVCVCVCVCVCVSVAIPFILDVRLVDVPAGVTGRRRGTREESRK